MARARRSRVILLSAILLALLLLLGSSGLFTGGTTEPSPQGEVAVAPARGAGSVLSHPPEPNAESHARADRLGGLLHTMRHAMGAGRLGEAWRALERARHLPSVPDELRQLRQDAAIELEQVTASACRHLRELLIQGRVLEATARLRAMRTVDHPALRRRCAILRSELPTRSALLAARARLPACVTLREERSVRVWQDGRVRPARIVRSRGERVTVKIRSREGVRYPVLRRVEVEPLAADAEDVLQQIAAAVRAEDPWLAGLWLAYAEARGLRGSKRLGELRELLLRGARGR